MFAVELRLTAVAMVTRGDSHARVCQVIGCSRATLARWLTYYRFDGTVWADADRENSHRDGVQFNDDLMSAITAMARHDPLSLLSEHAAVLQGLRDFDPAVFGDLNCSTSTVSRCLRRLGFTRKKIERLFRERNEEARAQHCQLRRQIPRRCIVSVDETHTDGDDVFHLKGWAPRQEKLRILDRDPRSVPRTSTVMAVSGTGAILGLHSCVLGPAMTSNDWRIFCENVMPQLNFFLDGSPWEDQPDNCVLLFDNASIHDAATDEFLQANGVHFIRLPPYSPDLQPIEGVFNDLKCHIRTLVHEDSSLLDRPLELQALAASMITQRQVKGQFERVSHVIDCVCDA